MGISMNKGADATKAAPEQPSEPVQAAPDPHAGTMLLELALYKNFQVGKGAEAVIYERGKVYRFQRETAEALLQQSDTGRPIWRMWSKPAARRQASNMVDARSVAVPRRAEPIHGGVDETELRGRQRQPAGQEVHIGDDAEIDGILNRPDDGNVTI